MGKKRNPFVAAIGSSGTSNGIESRDAFVGTDALLELALGATIALLVAVVVVVGSFSGVGADLLHDKAKMMKIPNPGCLFVMADSCL